MCVCVCLCILDVLKNSADGRMYLRLRDVLIDRHGVNPLMLHQSSESDPGGERESLMAFLMSAAGDDDDDGGVDGIEGTAACSSTRANASDSRRSETASETPAKSAAASNCSISGAAPTIASSPFGPSCSVKSTPSGFTGPASRKPAENAAYDITIQADSAAESSTIYSGSGKRNKGKAKDEVSQVIADGFQAYRETATDRQKKKEERLATKDALEDARLKMEEDREKREAEKHRLEMEAAKRQEHMWQVKDFLTFHDDWMM